jgi:signal transduction histidine kinase
MVDDLLDLAKIEAGRITISPAWFELMDLFTALRGMFRPIVDGTEADLIFEAPDGMPKLYTDDKKLAQILRNFISNALKFTPRGEVRVTAQMDGPDHVRFAVTDTGIGIPEELQSVLFEDFAQIDSPLQKRLRGTGLGLSLCRQFAHLLGGEVGLESTAGVGSVFHVVLPLKVTEGAADAAE